jgi:hypothetical protein
MAPVVALSPTYPNAAGVEVILSCDQDISTEEVICEEKIPPRKKEQTPLPLPSHPSEEVQERTKAGGWLETVCRVSTELCQQAFKTLLGTSDKRISEVPRAPGNPSENPSPANSGGGQTQD